MHKLFHTALLGALAGACIAAPPVAADTYKWTDAEGKVHYSDQPPPANVKNPTTMTPRKRTSRSAPEADAEAPQPSPDARPAAPAGPKTSQELDAEFRQRQVKAAEDEAARKKAQQEAAEKKRNCAQATNNVKRFEEGGRLTRYNDKGEMEFLEDAEIAGELARARQAADSWCK
jgi:hypothetical protein